MRIFISFPSELESIAESIAQSLRNRDYDVFFSHDDLPPGDSFDMRVENAIAKSDFMVFLISPKSVTKGRYTLTELAFARTKWLSPSKRVLPVMIEQTPLETIPNYLRAVTILEPEGNVAAEIRSAVDRILQPSPSEGLVTNTFLMLPLALMSLVSAFACYLSIKLFGWVLPFSFSAPTTERVTILPGLIFGLLTAVCNGMFGVRDRFQLGLVVILTTLGWIAASDMTQLTDGVLRQYQKTVISNPTQTSESSVGVGTVAGAEQADSSPNLSPTTKQESLAGNYIGGLIGGAVGGAFTLLGLVFTNQRFRRPESLIFSLIVAAVVGALFGLVGTIQDDLFWILLFLTWQTSVILSIARGFPLGSGKLPNWWPRKFTASASYTSPGAG